MPGLAAELLMEVMKINQVNELFAEAQPKQRHLNLSTHALFLAGCGVEIGI